MSIRDDAKIGPVHKKPFQTCQGPSPCLLALTLNNGKRERINLVVSIHCHCYQQLPLILAIEVRCIDAYHRLAMLEPFNTWTKSLKGTVKCASSQHTTVVAFQLWLDLHLLTPLKTKAVLRMTHQNPRRWPQPPFILHPKPYNETPNGRASHAEDYAGLLLFLKCLPIRMTQM